MGRCFRGQSTVRNSPSKWDMVHHYFLLLLVMVNGERLRCSLSPPISPRYSQTLHIKDKTYLYLLHFKIQRYITYTIHPQYKCVTFSILCICYTPKIYMFYILLCRWSECLHLPQCFQVPHICKRFRPFKHILHWCHCKHILIMQSLIE